MDNPTPQPDPEPIVDDLAPAPVDGFIRARDGGRPVQHPDFRERVKGGADPKAILAEAERYHADRGSFDEFKASKTYAWLKWKARQ